MEIVDKFGRYIYLNYGVQITDCLTISKLAINILYFNYLNELEDQTKNSLPLIKNPSVFDFIKKAYFGGISEVYRPYGENLFYYDINSEYPFVAKNSMPGNTAEYLELQDSEVDKGGSLDLENLFGYFYCKIKTNSQYLGLLPLHLDNRLVLPEGEYYGYWNTEELKLAKKYGYEIQVIKGYHFNKLEGLFNKFVDDLYSIRLAEKGIAKSITKRLLNSAFGRFGMSINKPETQLVDEERLISLLATRKVLEVKRISEDRFIISYESKLSREIAEELELDLSKLVKQDKDLEYNNKFGVFSIATAAFITAYGRVYINKIKLLILKLGGKIYYSDTDSIVTDINLPVDLVGHELGKFKLEYKIKKGIFISSKTYLLELEDGTFVKKAKGVDSQSISNKDYYDMYLFNKDITALKTQSKLDFEEGSVNIFDSSAVIRHNSYSKREKIYDGGIWVDTKPLNINNLPDFKE